MTYYCNGLIPGTNKFASQKGMSMGKVRHVADIRADDMVPEGHDHVTLQSGTNQFASQKGMSMGKVRHIADIRADDLSREGMDHVQLQSGLSACPDNGMLLLENGIQRGCDWSTELDSMGMVSWIFSIC